MSNPEVSVVMPVYNAESYVAEAIESILSQSFSDFEFLIFDDGSTDGSRTIVGDYVRCDGRVRLFEHSHKGYAHWLNEGIRIARGEFIARMDADDISLTERLTDQVKYMREHPKCVVVGCDTLIIDQNGRQLGVDRHESRPEFMEELLLNGTHGVIAHPTSLMRRRTLLTIGLYREEFECIEDFDLWLRLTEVGELGNVSRPLFKYRVRPGSVCSTKFRTQEHHADTIITQARMRRGLKPLKRSVWPYVHRTDDEAARLQLWSGCFLSLGNRKAALQYALSAILRRPFAITSWMALCRVVIPQYIKKMVRNIFVKPVNLHRARESRTTSNYA